MRGKTEVSDGRRQKMTVEERFWSKVAKKGPDDCWLWLASSSSHVEGTADAKFKMPQFSFNSRRTQATHVAWILTHGALPATAMIFRSCSNVRCVNPNHLRAGTEKNSTNRRLAKGRHTRCEWSPAAKLTRKEVREIRKAYSEGVTQKALSVKYGVQVPAISRIVNYVRWKDMRDQVDIEGEVEKVEKEVKSIVGNQSEMSTPVH